jgi:ribonuclease BN (tRNA processing enzyme)
MTIRVLGCSGAIAQGCRTTAFLMDDAVLIDAGTGVGDLSLEALVKIDHILISHSHLDHVLSIALLADSVMRERATRKMGPITVHGLPQTLLALQQHVFNNVIWPDFTGLPTPENPALRFESFELGDVLHLAGREIEVLSAAHTVAAVGFAVHGPQGAWVYTGDTGPNPALWQRLQNLRIAHLVIEVAFGDDDAKLAHVSKHLCPSMLGRELQHLQGSVQVHITHIKPGDMASVMQQIACLKTPHLLSALTMGQVMVLD